MTDVEMIDTQKKDAAPEETKKVEKEPDDCFYGKSLSLLDHCLQN
jgi:hypothetical protein